MSDTQTPVESEVSDNTAKDSGASKSEFSTTAVKKTAESVRLSPSKAKKEELKHASLKDFILPLYGKQKLNKLYRESFTEIVTSTKGTFVPLTVEDRDMLLELSLDKDPNHKITLELAQFLLEKRGNPTLREYLLSYIEYLVSHTGNLKKLGKTSIFQVWLDDNGVSRQLDFLCGQIDRIKDGFDDQDTPKELGEKNRNNLKCIAAIWLYLKKKVTFQSLTEQLSESAFSLKGESCSESKSVGFIADMVGSTNKHSFAHFFNYQKSYQQALRADVEQSKAEKRDLSVKIYSQKNEISQLNKKLDQALAERDALKETITNLQNQLDQTKTKASHQGIHQRDELQQLRSKVCRTLEDNILVNLKSAETANSRNPPKAHVVEIKLKDIIEQIEDQIEWLKR
ncbi:MAG: hypothetical protein ACR2PX_08960 [Endozoicomonas sp.]|uniref:hypothetical protein n=1 Tax=Endozoicomonas sp. TaxID=1892382 RepID=UPI003D9B52F0